MKNKFNKIGIARFIAIIAALSCCIFAFSACASPPKDITGVSFENLTVYYDGNEHSVTITGTLPEGVSVTYENNVGTETGKYEAVATLSGKGYKTLILRASLTIADRLITGITFDDLTVDYDGNEHTITVTGTVPDDANVTYENNVATEPGVYEATATITRSGYKTLVLKANLTINEVPFALVSNADELLAAAENGGLIILKNDITLDGGKVVSVTKDTYINGKGHTITATDYSESDYRVINITGKTFSKVVISDLKIVAEKSVPYLRGINLYETENLTLELDGVDVTLGDYYALNILMTNVRLKVNMRNCNLTAWAAVYNRASRVEFNAENCVFEGINTHNSPDTTSNHFSTFVISEYVLLNGDEFISENLSANNIFTLTNCSLIATIAQNADGELLDTKQYYADMRSPYNNKFIFINCTLGGNGGGQFKSAYDSAYIPEENRDNPYYVVDTNVVIVNGVDVTADPDVVEKYFDN